MYYAGIGSRKTPKFIIGLMEASGHYLASNGYTLRSGGAKGSDQAFERGCDAANGEKEIYLPWKGFENNPSNLIVSDNRAFEIAKQFHPYWHNLKQGGRKLQARNSHQILGKDLNTPVDFVLCYTKNGAREGGTGQALRIATKYNIPIFDMGLYQNKEDLKKEFKSFLKRFVKKS